MQKPNFLPNVKDVRRWQSERLVEKDVNLFHHVLKRVTDCVNDAYTNSNETYVNVIFGYKEEDVIAPIRFLLEDKGYTVDFFPEVFTKDPVEGSNFRPAHIRISW